MTVELLEAASNSRLLRSGFVRSLSDMSAPATGGHGVDR